ncbi:SusD-like protein [Formosa agariphila KMM 3901]|uniref:SusD-like protein n=1 Tax=Formosa agariphila (strain DSM 15362 / KCTC 12365 / LMG 23005 / KMM 3901 / M-2Alg 35-1) TaxID=1347342 RepID=T2KHG8_FORAG|nr:SusD/RagB family nutrient-binding outer membrane lipoprotein [Formosa agariphila]CDF78265.1 SusD-like protein [Formosa agariphila KMM 3901]
MKKIFITALSFIVLASCMSDEKYESYNKDPKNPTEVEAAFLFNSATKSLFDQMTSTNVNVNVFRLLGQYWTETTYIDEANYDLNNRNIPQYHWSELYRDVLLDLKTAKEYTEADVDLSEADKNTRLAQIEILEVYTWQQLVDTFGDIPYSQALQSETTLLPEYDDAATIYEDLVSRINTAIPNLSGTGFSEDNIYYGDISSWMKFGNSLKLRIGMRIVDAPGMAALAQTTIESAVDSGVFTSNADNANIQYAAATPNTNPLWVDLVQSGRADFVPANTLVDYMNMLDDPRRPVYFEENLGEGVYTGGIYGAANSFAAYTHIGTVIHEPTFRGVLLDFSEVSFFLADAAQRGFAVGDTAETFYINGITASFDEWGVDGVEAYLAKPEVAYNAADWKTSIGNQFWLAMYNRGFEGWTVWRTYDTPEFNLPEDTGNPVPTRYTYPINEQNLNEPNWSAASTAIGGDEQTTKLFWDVN